MKHLIAFAALLLAPLAAAQTPPQATAGVAEARVFKKVGDRELKVFIEKPPGWKTADRRPAMVFFFGGGWVGGDPQQFRRQSEYLATRGMVGIRVEYRVIAKGDGGPPLVCCADAKSAMRWVRSHAGELGIDSQRIGAGGGSAGGHLAAFASMVDGLDDPRDDLNVSPRANALVLFNPVFDNGPDGGWGYARVGDRYKEFSPAHNIIADDPPAIVFLGREDKLIPVATVERFQAAMKAAGRRCDAHYYDRQGHGFFNQEPFRSQTLIEADKFLASLGWLAGPPTLEKTSVSIVGEDFHINGRPTYAGRSWNGHRIEGLLLNSRMVQATFDDLNPETAKRWAYADTGKWDAERNVREFIAALPEWKAHGLLAVTVNFQGGSPEGYSKGQAWESGAFTAEGGLRPEFAERMRRVLDAADANGMVVILGYFYFGQSPRLAGDDAAIHATDAATRWLLEGGWRNVLVEINNESNPTYHPPILRPDRVSELIERVRAAKAADGHTLLVGTSFGGRVVPSANAVAVSDFALIHGNGAKEPGQITELIRKTRAVPTYKPMSILINEDDHESFDLPVNNFTTAISEHVSWGWFDYRRKGEGMDEGYQSPPVNWGVSSGRKRAFFKLLSEITGTAKP